MSPEEWLATKYPKGDTALVGFGAPGTTKEDKEAGILSEADINVTAPTSKTRQEEGKPKVLSPEEWLAKKESQSQSPEDWLKNKKPEEKKTSGGIGNTLLDVADVVASTPAFVAGAATGLGAAVLHASDPTKPTGEHFGAANAVFEAVMEMGGNPIRKALTGAGIMDKQEGSTSVITDTFDWLGKKIEAASSWVGETTGSKEAQEATKFGLTTVGPPLAIKGAIGTAKGAGKVVGKAKDALVKDVEQPKPLDPDYVESKIKPEESIPEVLTRKREREAIVERIAKQQEESTAKVGEVVKKSTYFLDEEGSYAALRDKDTAFNKSLSNRKSDKETQELQQEIENLKEISRPPMFEGSTKKSRPRTLEEDLRLAEAEDEFSLVHLKNNPRDNLIPFKEQLTEELNYLSNKEEYGPDDAYTKQRIPKIEKLLKDLDTFEVKATQRVLKLETPKKPPLAKTDKEGKVTLDESAIDQDFKDGFKYIFDSDSPTGYQKQLVFEQLGLSKEEFIKLIPDAETYKTFIKAHEESHVRNGDHETYPRTSEGKLDLTNQKALDIEARATADALKEIAKPKPEEVALQNVIEFITSEQTQHGTVLQGVTDILAKSANVILAKTREADIFAKTIEKAIPVTELRDKMTRAAEGEKDWDRLLKDADKAETLDGMSKAISKWEKQLPPEKNGVSGADRLTRLKFVKERLERIGSEEGAIGLLKTIEARIAAIGEQAKKLGLIEQLRTNYIPHVLDWSKSKLTPKERQNLLDKIANAPKDSKLVRDFTEQRKFQFLRELEKAVEGTGVVVLTDIAKVTLAYEKAMQTAIIHKAMFDYLKTNKGPDGKPWVLPDGPEAKTGKYVSFGGVGTQVMRDLRVHPDLVDSMNFLFRQTDPNVIIRTLGGITHLTKSINTVASFFHAKSLFEAGTLTAPILMAKEIGREVLHLVFKRGPGSGARQAMDAFKNGGNEVMTTLYLEQGLTIAMEDIQRTIVAETGKNLDAIASKLLPKGKELQLVQRITEPLDQIVLQKVNAFTWDYMYAGQKLNMAFHQHQKIKLKNPDMSDRAIAKEVSLYVNRTFGGINWLEEANNIHNKYLRAVALKIGGLAGRDWAQLLLFAPDWTYSTLRAFTSALPKELAKPQNWELREGVKGIVNPKTAGDLSRRYVISTALAWTTIINAINLAVSDKPIWENDDPTRIQFQDGTSMQAAKHSMEAVHWMMAPDKTAGNKLAFGPKAIFVSVSGTAYPSPDAPKLKDTSVIGRLKAIGTLALPFPVSSAVQAPEGQGTTRATSSMLGAPIYGISKEDRSKAIKKGKQEAKLKRQEAR